MPFRLKNVGHYYQDLEEILGEIRKYNITLNTAKYSFKVEAKKFLGFMLARRGIEANLEKCKAIIEMSSPTNQKEVQQLTKKVTIFHMPEENRPVQMDGRMWKCCV